MNQKILELKRRQIYFGTSSWKYPGWKGLLYRKEYKTQKEFNETCLAEYSENLTAVGVDHTYYTWPTAQGISTYCSQTPQDFRFGLKATERLTILQYPKLKRYGKDAGTKNASFLDPGAFRESFLEPLRPYSSRLAPIMLEFSQFYPGTIGSGADFVALLDKFFGGLRGEEGFRYAVEIRNANWLQKPYFECLIRHGVSHVFNSWTRMPSLLEQLKMSAGYPLPAFPARILLQPGTKYEQAVEAFSPYDRIQAEYPELRQGAPALVERALEAGAPAYVFVNNRAEGCAPRTIEAILDLISHTA